MLEKILVADDSLSLLNLTKACLTQEGYEVITAQNGIEALEKLYHENPALVVLDVMMPEMTGYQVCRIMKNDKETQNIPIILLTALEQQKDKFWGLKTGADKYIPKTSDFVQTLITDVQTLLKKFGPLPRPKTLSDRKVDASEIISWVNSLLDKQLFESTIINEANNLAISIQDYQQIIKEFLLLVNQIMSYKIGAIFLIGEKENELWIKTNIEIAENVIKQLQQKIIKEIENQVKKLVLPPAGINVIYAKKDEYYELETCNSLDEMQTYFSKPLYLHNTCVGLFAIAEKRFRQFDSEEIHTCNLVLNQGLIAIDNAKLYKLTQELAITDGLTKLYNHRYFQEQLEKEVRKTMRYKHPFSLIMIDFDHFKHFNDRYGHQAGDEILKETADIIKSCLRSEDIVARYGGEEFVIIIPDASIDAAITVAEKLRKTVEAHNFSIRSRHPEEKITISLGAASFPDDAGNKTELLSKADERLYQAKKLGRNQVCSGIQAGK